MRLNLPAGEFRGYIYDCDGTLADSMELHFRAWRRAFERCGARFDFDWDLFLRRAGMGVEETVSELNREFGEALEPGLVVAEQRSAFLELLPTLTPIPAVVEHARRTHRFAPQCVASGGERPIVEQELALLGIRELFQFVVCPDEVTRGKPDPEMFFLCAKRMDVPASECLVFEDGALGLEAARAAGMAWVAVDGSGRFGVPEKR